MRRGERCRAHPRPQQRLGLIWAWGPVQGYVPMSSKPTPAPRSGSVHARLWLRQASATGTSTFPKKDLNPGPGRRSSESSMRNSSPSNSVSGGREAASCGAAFAILRGFATLGRHCHWCPALSQAGTAPSPRRRLTRAHQCQFEVAPAAHCVRTGAAAAAAAGTARAPGSCPELAFHGGALAPSESQVCTAIDAA